MTVDPRLDDLAVSLWASPSPFHAVAEAARRLDAAGYTALDEREPGGATPERGYVIRDGAIVAWAGLASAPDDGLLLLGAHTDSPNLRIRPRPDLARQGTAQLGVEPYGGLLLNSWLGRELGLSGRVALRDGRMVLVRSDEPLLHLPQLAIHLDREVTTKGLLVDPQKHSAPLWGLGERSFRAWAAGAAGVEEGEVVAWDVMAHDLTRPSVAGADGSLFASARLDNQVSCWAAVSALLSAGRGMVALWDHEEIGSSSNRGAASPLVPAVLELALPDPAARRQAIARGLCVSSDMAHATHPSYPEKHEPEHTIALGGGVVVKTNVNQRYATDARSAQPFVAACERAGVGVQWYSHRADLPCGSTIGPITAAQLGISVVDVGAPMLAMHSARELMAGADALALEAALTAFLSA